MTKKRKTGLAISATVACIAVLCVAGACNGATEEQTVHQAIMTTTASALQTTERIITTAPSVTTSAIVTTTAKTTMEPQITTTITCSTTEQGICEMPTPTTTTEQTTAADTTVQPTTTTTPVTTTAPAPAESYHGQTSGNYIYVNGFGWIFNEGGGGEGSVNYEMYCNGNKIGYFG